MANEEKVAQSLIQPVKVALVGNVPTEDVAKYFVWEFRNGRVGELSAEIGIENGE